MADRDRRGPGPVRRGGRHPGYANLLSGVPGCTVYHDVQSVSTYCYTGTGGQWWSFDDAWSIGQKTAWIKQKGLLGGMIWEMSGDTAAGTLMSAVHSGL
ncbi:glycosyl hydrolase family 18 protein [Catellatospora coxensis]